MLHHVAAWSNMPRNKLSKSFEKTGRDSVRHKGASHDALELPCPLWCQYRKSTLSNCPDWCRDPRDNPDCSLWHYLIWNPPQKTANSEVASPQKEVPAAKPSTTKGCGFFLGRLIQDWLEGSRVTRQFGVPVTLAWPWPFRFLPDMFITFSAQLLFLRFVLAGVSCKFAFQLLCCLKHEGGPRRQCGDGGRITSMARASSACSSCPSLSRESTSKWSRTSSWQNMTGERLGQVSREVILTWNSSIQISQPAYVLAYLLFVLDWMI